MLKDNDSVLLVINPKPNDKTNNWEFVKAHFSNTSFLNKILILSNEFINIPRYIKMIVGQNELTKMAKRRNCIR